MEGQEQEQDLNYKGSLMVNSIFFIQPVLYTSFPLPVNIINILLHQINCVRSGDNHENTKPPSHPILLVKTLS